MKVLWKTPSQKIWINVCTCTGPNNSNAGCGAILLVEQEDLFKTEFKVKTNIGEDTQVSLKFKCPECGVLTDVDSSNPQNHTESYSVWEKVTRNSPD